MKVFKKAETESVYRKLSHYTLVFLHNPSDNTIQKPSKQLDKTHFYLNKLIFERSYMAKNKAVFLMGFSYGVGIFCQMKSE